MEEVYGREAHIAKLKSLALSVLVFSRQKEPSVFVTGLPSTGKTLTCRAAFEHFDKKLVSWVNCVECLTIRILFERILKQFTGLNSRCDQPDQFVHQIQEINRQHKTRRFVILDKCEELLNVGSDSTLDFLYRLGELTKTDICVVFISHLKWDDLIPRLSAPCPTRIDFLVYSTDEALKIISLDCPEGEDVDFYLRFATTVYGTFSTSCLDLNELRYVIKLLYPKYIEPITSGKGTPRAYIVKKEETSKLFTNLKVVMSKHLSAVFLREVSGLEWDSHINDSSTLTKGMSMRRIDMPHKSKWLVIAGFLASYNPKKYDSRFFTRGGEGRAKVGRKGGVNNGSNTRSQLCGPKDFDIPRMLGIFHYIMPDDCKITFDIYTQIATLVTLRVFVKVSAVKRIDVMKLKCNVSFPFVKQLAKSMRFDISKYLYDWVDIEG